MRGRPARHAVWRAHRDSFCHFVDTVTKWLVTASVNFKLGHYLEGDVRYYFSFPVMTTENGKFRSHGVGLGVGCWRDFVSFRTFKLT